MSDEDPGGRSGRERLFWQDGRWRPGVLIDWARWNPELDAQQRAVEGRPTLNGREAEVARLWRDADRLSAAPQAAARRASHFSALPPSGWLNRLKWWGREGAPAPAQAPLATAPITNRPMVEGDFDAPPAPPAPPPSKWRRRWPWIRRGLWALLALFAAIIIWLSFTAPPWRIRQPIAEPQLTLLSSDGRPIARHGYIVERPVEVPDLPPHVVQAFLAIEDRTFYSHIGVSARGLTRAVWTNITTGQTHGGSTITQQLAKFTFLNADRTVSRKLREGLIALWMEAWLSKDDILGRYLSNAHFGGRVYGLRAASLHYFYRQPERLTLSQATMLAGMMRAPNRYDPMRNLSAAQARQRVVLRAMVDAGYLSPAAADAVRPATTDHRPSAQIPSGTYFADWAMPQARDAIDTGYEEQRVTTTLDGRLQDIARRVVGRAELGGAQVALVAMRPNGEVVAMIGGRSYAASQFNRVTSPNRQSGSAFKLIVFYAALRAGLTPDSLVDDNPITTGNYRPANAGGRYRGQITLREAFAQSSNVVAVRLYQELGSDAINAAARELGITANLPPNASVALGSASTSLLELTSAYAAIAAGRTPVEPHALVRPEQGWLERLFDSRSRVGSTQQEQMMDMLRAVVDNGTGRAARLAIPAYGKTGTSQQSRDAIFVGFAGDLVVGVWIGRDDNQPLRNASGGGLPARIWRDFMVNALPGAAPRRERPRPQPQPPAQLPDIFDDVPVTIDTPAVGEGGPRINGQIGDVEVSVGGDGINVNPGPALRERLDAARRAAEDAARRAREGAADAARRAEEAANNARR